MIQNKTRDEIFSLIEVREDELDSQLLRLSRHLNQLNLIEDSLRLGLSIKSPPLPKTIVLFRHENKKIFVHVNDIVKIIASDDYVRVHDRYGVKSEPYIATLKELEKELAGTAVVRVNNNTMLNIYYIQHVHSDAIFVLNEKDEIPLLQNTARLFL